MYRFGEMLYCNIEDSLGDKCTMYIVAQYALHYRLHNGYREFTGEVFRKLRIRLLYLSSGAIAK